MIPVAQKAASGTPIFFTGVPVFPEIFSNLTFSDSDFLAHLSL